jgi:hypothetical protein
MKQGQTSKHVMQEIPAIQQAIAFFMRILFIQSPGFLFNKMMASCFLAGVLLLSGFSWENTMQPAPAMAQVSGYGFSPQRFMDGTHYGNGLYFAPYTFRVYAEPREKAALIGEFRWSQKTSSNNITVETSAADRRSVKADNVFFSFFPQRDIAMMAVISENGEGWVEVIYDQARNLTGWVRLKENTTASASNRTSASQTKDAAQTDPKNAKPNGEATNGAEPLHFGVYQTWPEFMKLNAKANGIYWLSGVKEYNKALRTSDQDEAKLIPVTIIRNMKVKHLRANWLLVEVMDFENNTPIGWVRWRDDDGNLMAFPNINQQYHPVIIGNF